MPAAATDTSSRSEPRRSPETDQDPLTSSSSQSRAERLPQQHVAHVERSTWFLACEVDGNWAPNPACLRCEVSVR